MKNRFGSNKHVNFGIALALVGILVFSLATSVEGFGLKEGATAGETPATKPSAKGKDVIKKAQQMLENLEKSKPKPKLKPT